MTSYCGLEEKEGRKKRDKKFRLGLVSVEVRVLRKPWKKKGT
jgi:hypothetical protein